MVGYPPLWVVVGPDFCRAIPGRNHSLTLAGDTIKIFLILNIVEPGTEFCERLLQIFYLRFLILALHHEPSGYMGKPNGTVGGVHALPAWAARAVGILTDILHFQIYVKLFGLWEHHHRCGRCVYASLGFGLRHTLYPVHPALVLHDPIHPLPREAEDDLLEAPHGTLAGTAYLQLPPLGLGEA